MYDVIIVGMGISGITAGIYAKRKGLNVLMFEKKAPGGTLMNLGKITNYPGFKEIEGPDLAMELFNQVNALKIPFKNEEVFKVESLEDKKIVKTNKGEYEAKNVILALGRTPKYIGLDNEKDYLGRGLSTCATCDGFLYRNEDVAVVGNNSIAFMESVYLSNLCNKVYLINKDEKFKTDDEVVSEVKNAKNIEVLFNSNVKNINETDGKISSITLDNNKEINVKGVFIYIGYRPDTDNFKELDILNENGDIIVDDAKETKIKGIFAIGDCTKKNLYQLVTASSDGAISISSINKN